MLRLPLGCNIKKHINMENIRQKVKMMSINQMCVYHTILEAYNVIRNSSSECIKRKWEYKHGNRYLLRSESTNDLTIPVKPISKCVGFTYNGAKLFNKLPMHIKKTLNPTSFKSQIKSWIWENIPSF